MCPHEIKGTPDLLGECRHRRQVVSASPSVFEQMIVSAIESANQPPTGERHRPGLLGQHNPRPKKSVHPKKHAATKLKMHQLIYEAEFECCLL